MTIGSRAQEVSVRSSRDLFQKPESESDQCIAFVDGIVL